MKREESMYLNEMTLWGVKQFDPANLLHSKCFHNHHRYDHNKFRVETPTRFLSENPSTYLR